MNAPPDPTSQDAQALERQLASMLRGLPPRTAPGTLQARVFAALARRATLPWWRRTFRHWPAAARAAFVTVCGGLVALTAVGGTWALTRVPALATAGTAPLEWLAALGSLERVAADLVGSLGRTLPLSWLYGAIVVALTLYALVFVLGATAYRIARLEGDRP